VRSVSRICVHLSIVYVTYTIDERAHMRETERTSGHRLSNLGEIVHFSHFYLT